MVAAKHVKKIIPAGMPIDIYAKDDEKNLQNPLLNEPEPDMDSNPEKWKQWDLARQRAEEIKARRNPGKGIDASNKRGVQS